jgi:hypothetical protein
MATVQTAANNIRSSENAMSLKELTLQAHTQTLRKLALTDDLEDETAETHGCSEMKSTRGSVKRCCVCVSECRCNSTNRLSFASMITQRLTKSWTLYTALLTLFACEKADR